MFKPFNARSEAQIEFNEILVNTDHIYSVARYRKKPDQTILVMESNAILDPIIQGPYESVSKYILGTSDKADLEAMGLEK